MAKKKQIEKITSILAKSIRHKIGSILNPDEFYASKYAKDAELLLTRAQVLSSCCNWNKDDAAIIRKKLLKKLNTELDKKEFIDDRKYAMMDDEVDTALDHIGIVLHRQ